MPAATPPQPPPPPPRQQHQQQRQHQQEHQQQPQQNSTQLLHRQIQLNNVLATLGHLQPAPHTLVGAAPTTMQANGNGAMAVGPTPAGHQAELNIIYGMVEELSRQLAENRRVTEDIVSSLGRVRNRARERGLSNDDVLDEAAAEIFSQEPNMEAAISILTESLDRAKNSRDANLDLVTKYARVLATILGQFHTYKEKHIADVSAWHRSYRAQLAEARAENSRLREQIWDMQEHAGKANAMLREFRKKYDEDEKRWDQRVEDKARKQELRFWKRLAMPDVADDEEGYWSDDDDLIDPMEKERLKEVERKIAEQNLASLAAGSQHSEDDSDGDGELAHPQGILGGVAMERERDGSMPTPPSRPASTGSTGDRLG